MNAPTNTTTKLGFVGLALLLAASAQAEGWERRPFRGDGYYSPPPAHIADEPRRFDAPEPIVRPLPGPTVGPSLLDRDEGRSNRDRLDRSDRGYYRDDRGYYRDERGYYRDERGYVRDPRFRRDPYYGRSYRHEREFGVPSAPIVNQYPNSWMSRDGPPPVGY